MSWIQIHRTGPSWSEEEGGRDGALPRAKQILRAHQERVLVATQTLDKR